MRRKFSCRPYSWQVAFIEGEENGEWLVTDILVLPENTKEALRQLRELSSRVQGGDKEARGELRRALDEAAPEIVSQAAGLSRRAEMPLVRFVAAGDLLAEEALSRHLENMRREIAGQHATPLELLLSEHITGCWLAAKVVDGLIAANLYQRSEGKNQGQMPFSLAFYRWVLKWQEHTHRRYLSSIRELARVRKLQSNTPAVQVNTQINVSPGKGENSV
jgi:hypothetical protein